MEITAVQLFERAIDELRKHYDEFDFHAERDVVWTVQKELARTVRELKLPFRIVSGYPIMRSPRRSLTADLAILNARGDVELAAEFKYEPAHPRQDIWPTKFPVVIWTKGGGVLDDIERVHRCVEQGVAKTAYAVFIDEGAHFRHRDPYRGSSWLDWGVGPTRKAAIHWCKVAASTSNSLSAQTVDTGGGTSR